jgi:hypothetical protein
MTMPTPTPMPREEKIRLIERERKILEIQKLQSEAEPQQLESSKQSPILESIGKAFRAVDSYSGAPIRAGMQAFQKGDSLGDVARTIKNQFGSDPSTAPSGEDIFANAGVPRQVSLKTRTMRTGDRPGDFIVLPEEKETKINPAAVAGLGLEMATDPINYVPLGPIAGGATKLAGKATEIASAPIAKGLRNFAEQRAVKATTGESISALRKMTKTTLQDAGDVEKAEKILSRIGGDVLDEGSIKAFDNVENIAPRLSSSRKEYGAAIGDVGKEIDKIKPKSVNASNIAKKIQDYAESIPETNAGKNLQDKLISEAANFESIKGLSFEDAQKFKNQFKYKPQDADALISNQDATNKIRQIISKEMEDTAESVGGKELAKKYKESKSKYDTFKKASNSATDRVQKNLSNRFVSPSDYGVGVSAGLLSSMNQSGEDGESKLKSVAVGALGAMTHKFLRTRGSSFSAVTANSISKTLKESPEFVKKYGEIIAGAASKGPLVLNSTHKYLMQNNPDYKDSIDNTNHSAMKRRLGESNGKP